MLKFIVNMLVILEMNSLRDMSQLLKNIIKRYFQMKYFRECLIITISKAYLSYIVFNK